MAAAAAGAGAPIPRPPAHYGDVTLPGEQPNIVYMVENEGNNPVIYENLEDAILEMDTILRNIPLPPMTEAKKTELRTKLRKNRMIYAVDDDSDESKLYIWALEMRVSSRGGGRRGARTKRRTHRRSHK